MAMTSCENNSRDAAVANCSVVSTSSLRPHPSLLLQREMKIAVIENEYGAVSIDTALVEENVREVRGGERRSEDY